LEPGDDSDNVAQFVFSSAATMSYEHSATNRFAGQVEVMSESRRALEERFERVLGEHGAAISRLAYSYEAVAGIREELVREIALAIWRALPHFRGECSERTFVFRIAHNRGLTHVRRASRPAAVAG
jgi:DNA-directed RNA polymerase specialized sigma24 family protein